MATKQTFEGTIEAQSTKAILFHGVYWEVALWLPRSQIEVFNDEDSFVIEVSGWLSGKNNLNEFTYYDQAAIDKRSQRE